MLACDLSRQVATEVESLEELLGGRFELRVSGTDARTTATRREQDLYLADRSECLEHAIHADVDALSSELAAQERTQQQSEHTRERVHLELAG